MNIHELYDGEKRSRGWWKIVRRHTFLISLLISVTSSTIFALATGAHGSDVPIGILFLASIICLALWPILIGVSMLVPRLAFSFFYWNFWLLLILHIPSIVISSMFLKFVLHWEMYTNTLSMYSYILLPFMLIGIAILIKTAILYKRFKVVAHDKDGQYLPV